MAGSDSSRSWSTDDLPDDLIYLVAWLYFAMNLSVSDVARYLVENYAHELPWLTDSMDEDEQFNKTRLKISPMLREALKRRFLRFDPPVERSLAERIIQRFELDPLWYKLEVVNIPQARVADTRYVWEQVAIATANAVWQRILQIANGRQGRRVHLGLGAGGTTEQVVRHLGQIASSATECPPLALHSMTSGFSKISAHAPVTFLRFFDTNRVDITNEPLWSAPIVRCEEYEETKRQPVVGDAFDKKGKSTSSFLRLLLPRTSTDY